MFVFVRPSCLRVFVVAFVRGLIDFKFREATIFSQSGL